MGLDVCSTWFREDGTEMSIDSPVTDKESIYFGEKDIFSILNLRALVGLRSGVILDPVPTLPSHPDVLSEGLPYELTFWGTNGRQDTKDLEKSPEGVQNAARSSRYYYEDDPRYILVDDLVAFNWDRMVTDASDGEVLPLRDLIPDEFFAMLKQAQEHGAKFVIYTTHY